VFGQRGPVGRPRHSLYPGHGRYPGAIDLSFDARLPFKGHGVFGLRLHGLTRRSTLHFGGVGFLRLLPVLPTDAVGKMLETVSLTSNTTRARLAENAESVQSGSSENVRLNSVPHENVDLGRL
jgi:hypothetical protein